MDQACGSSALHDMGTSPRVLVINTVRGTLLAPVNDLIMHLRLLLPSLRQSIPNRPSAAAIITDMYRRLLLALSVHLSRIFSPRSSAGFDPDPMDLTLRDECTPRGSIPAKRRALYRTIRVLFGIRPRCLWKRCCYDTPSRYHTARCYHALSWRYELFVIFIALLLFFVHPSRADSYTPDSHPVLLLIRHRQSLYELRYLMNTVHIRLVPS
jgi:hypothetical protein